MKALRHFYQTTLIVAVFFFFQSCLESEFPLTTAAEAIPKNFIGTWYETKDLSEPKVSRTKYDVTKGKNNTLIIKQQEYSSYTKEWDITWYKGHLSKVKDVLFYNCKKYNSEEDFENDNTENGYWFFKIESEGSLIKMSPIKDDESLEFNNSKELYDFVSNIYNKSYVYDRSYEKTLIKKEAVEK
jgi:hypothetical protein